MPHTGVWVEYSLLFLDN